MVKISGRSDESFGSYHVNGRTATLTDFRVYSLFEYTKKQKKVLFYTVLSQSIACATGGSHRRERVDVWCVMSNQEIIGSYFSEDEIVNRSHYLDMLKDHFYPIIQRKRLHNKIIFQQDSAATHFFQGSS